MMYSQMFNTLCFVADNEFGGRLPVHVRGLFDEFANIGEIPSFDKLIATIRSREISATIVLQSITQLKTLYKDSWEVLVGNCDTNLFLGGKETSTLKEWAETLGKQTIDTDNDSESFGQSKSKSRSSQKLARDYIDCIGVESTTPKINCSYAICGTNGRITQLDSHSCSLANTAIMRS